MASTKSLKEGENIPEEDRVLRYCKPKKDIDEREIAESAFTLKKEEGYISVNWLDFFNGNMTVPQRLQAVRDSIPLSLARNGRFAQIPVKEAKERILDIQVKYIPRENNCSHAGIYIANEQNREYTLELANIAMSHEIFPAREN